MKEVIRERIFETNSSSMHALAIRTKSDKDEEVNPELLKYTIKLNYDNTADFKEMSGEDIHTPYRMLHYIWSAICMHRLSGSAWAFEAEEDIKAWLPKCKFRPCEDIEICYINHQSSDVYFVREIMLDKELFYKVLKYGSIFLNSDFWSREEVEEDLKKNGYEQIIWGDAE